MQKLSAKIWKGLIFMLKKLITGILALAMCASTLAALPQGACAAEPDPTPIIVVDPEDPTPPVEPGEPEEPECQAECASEFPTDTDPVITG